MGEKKTFMSLIYALVNKKERGRSECQLTCNPIRPGGGQGGGGEAGRSTWINTRLRNSGCERERVLISSLPQYKGEGRRGRVDKENPL